MFCVNVCKRDTVHCSDSSHNISLTLTLPNSGTDSKHVWKFPSRGSGPESRQPATLRPVPDRNSFAVVSCCCHTGVAGTVDAGRHPLQCSAQWRVQSQEVLVTAVGAVIANARRINQRWKISAHVSIQWNCRSRKAVVCEGLVHGRTTVLCPRNGLLYRATTMRFLFTKTNVQHTDASCPGRGGASLAVAAGSQEGKCWRSYATACSCAVSSGGWRASDSS